MKITATDLQALGVADRIVPEPTGGAHRDPALAIASLKDAIVEEIARLQLLGPDELLTQRRAKFLAIG
jgi:acetyl-CoA carboxylase carboxyl transferase subunit alpha